MWKEYRPKLKIEKTTFQKVMNIIGYTLFAGATIFALISLSWLPSEVPIHFNFAGEVDNWGSKYVLLLLPLIGLIMLLAMEAVEKNPHLHNYPDRINESNVTQFYKLSIRTLNVMKNGVLILFALLLIEMVIVAGDSSFSFGLLLPIYTGIIIIVPIIWHLVSMRKIK